MEKVTKNNLTIISKPHAHPHTMEKTYAKMQNDWYKTVRGVALTRGTHCLYTEGEKWLSSQCGKSDKNVLIVIPKPYAHPHSMKKTHAKFQNNQYKTVKGVALTRGTHCLYIEVKKWLSSQCGKSDKKESNNYIQTTCISSYYEENICKVSKWSVQNCKRSFAHKTPRVNVDGKTNGQTDERTDGNLHA